MRNRELPDALERLSEAHKNNPYNTDGIVSIPAYEQKDYPIMEDRIVCRFEDWDDTTYPNPVCHCNCFRHIEMDCLNVPDDVGQCPAELVWCNGLSIHNAIL
jgi:hypothetical protein